MMGRPESLREAAPGLRRLLSHLGPYLRRRLGTIVSSFVALGAAVVFRLLEPWPLKLVFDEVFGASLGRSASGDFDWVGGPRWILLWACVAMVVITALRASAQYVNQVAFARLGNGVVSELRQDLFRHLQDLPLAFHDHSRTGDAVVRVINDVNLIRDVAVTAFLPLVANLLALLGMWGVMLWMDWRLTVMAAAALPLVALRGLGLSRRIHQAARLQRSRQSELATTAAESMSSIKNVQALSLEGAFLQRFGARNRSSQAQDVKSARLSASLGRTVDVLLTIATAAVLGIGGSRALAGEVSPGELLVFLTYLRRAFNPIKDLAKYSGRLAKASAAGERVVELLDRRPAIRDRPGAKPAPAFRGELCFEGVRFAYAGGPPVLDRLDLSIEPGGCVALVGPSGIGKSTMLDLVLRLREPEEGRVLVDGSDIRGYTLDSLRSQVSVLLQDSLLFGGTVRENVGLGLPGCSDEEIEAAIRLADAHGFVSALPQGYDSVIGERGANLSGGQKQRLAIARAAVRHSRILLLDEPTTGLDAESRRSVADALWRLAKGRTTLLVSHDLELCSRADRIVYLENGRIVESGRHEELLASGGRYSRLYHLQQGSGASRNEGAASTDEEIEMGGRRAVS